MLLLGQGNPRHENRLGKEVTVSSPAKKDVVVLVDEKLDVMCHCVLTSQKASCILACIKSSMASKVREVILPLCSALFFIIMWFLSSDPCGCFMCLHYLGNKVVLFHFS